MFIGPNKKLWTLNTMEQRNNKMELTFIEEDLILLVIVESQLFLSWCMTLIFHQSTNSASETNHRRREDEKKTKNEEKTKNKPSTLTFHQSTKRRRREDEEQTINSDLQSIDEEKTKNKPSSSSEMSKNRRDDGENEEMSKNRGREKEKGKQKLIVLPTLWHVCSSFLKKRIRKSQIKDQVYKF